MMWAVWSAACGAAGCENNPRGASWHVRFASSELAAELHVIEASIARGGCDSTDVLFRARSDERDMTLVPPVLDRGHYAFVAKALDTNCAWYARGCEERDLPIDDGAEIVTTLVAAAAEPACSVEQCFDGECRLPQDGGIDAPVEVDAPPDLDTGVMPTCPATVSSVGGGQLHTCAVANGGELWCWGIDMNGQTGTGPGNDTLLVPTRVGSETDWSVVAAGQSHTCAIRGGGLLYCWGANFAGEVGIGSMTGGEEVPMRVGTATDWAGVAVTHLETTAWRRDGTLWSWGRNTLGQLGIGTSLDADIAAPTRVGTALDWSLAARGYDHGCGIRATNALWCWGSNEMGQLGLGDSGVGNYRIAPAQVGGSWTAIGTGFNHTCALSSGSLSCWGVNSFGQLGLGDMADRSMPARVGTATDWTVITTGEGFHTCGVRSDHSLWCWGRNDSGQLGMGTPGMSVNTPRRVGLDSDWQLVASGRNFTCATRTDGSLWCWGANMSGQLGIGSMDMRSSPTRVCF